MATGVTDRTTLDRSLVHGIAWTSAVTWFGQILSWAMTFVVVHFVTKDDYGLVTMAAVYFGLVRMTSELGVGAAIVQFRSLSTDQISQFNGLSLLAGAAGVLLSLVAALPLGWFFRDPRLPLVVVVMSAVFFINAFRVVPQSLMQRELQFRTLSLIEGTQAIAAAVSTMTLAILGFGYWSLALGPVIGASVFTILVLAQRPTPFRWPQYEAIKQPIAYSGHTLASRFAWYGYSNADSVVIGRTLGMATAGAYGVGGSLAGVAVEKVTALIVRVTPAIFSAVQNDLAEMRRYFLRITEGLAMLTFPACVGMALVSDDLVRVMMGDEWLSAILPIQLLSFLAMPRSIDPLVNQVLAALGQARLNFHNALFTLAVVPFALYAGTPWGLKGVAIAAMIVVPLFFCRLLSLALHRLELPARDYIAALWPALSGCLVMAAVILSADRFILASAPLYAALVIKILLGAVTYAVALFVLHRGRVLMIRDLGAMLRARQKPDALTPDAQAPHAMNTP